jgi:hypothetical protein
MTPPPVRGRLLRHCRRRDGCHNRAPLAVPAFLVSGRCRHGCQDDCAALAGGRSRDTAQYHVSTHPLGAQAPGAENGGRLRGQWSGICQSLSVARQVKEQQMATILSIRLGDLSNIGRMSHGPRPEPPSGPITFTLPSIPATHGTIGWNRPVGVRTRASPGPESFQKLSRGRLSCSHGPAQCASPAQNDRQDQWSRCHGHASVSYNGNTGDTETLSPANKCSVSAVGAESGKRQWVVFHADCAFHH